MKAWALGVWYAAGVSWQEQESGSSALRSRPSLVRLTTRV
jgi:hypothetical protein